MDIWSRQLNAQHCHAQWHQLTTRRQTAGPARGSADAAAAPARLHSWPVEGGLRGTGRWGESGWTAVGPIGFNHCNSGRQLMPAGPLGWLPQPPDAHELPSPVPQPRAHQARGSSPGSPPRKSPAGGILEQEAPPLVLRETACAGGGRAGGTHAGSPSDVGVFVAAGSSPPDRPTPPRTGLHAAAAPATCAAPPDLPGDDMGVEAGNEGREQGRQARPASKAGKLGGRRRCSPPPAGLAAAADLRTCRPLSAPAQPLVRLATEAGGRINAGAREWLQRRGGRPAAHLWRCRCFWGLSVLEAFIGATCGLL